MNNTTEIIGCKEKYYHPNSKPVQLYDGKYLIIGSKILWRFDSSRMAAYTDSMCHRNQTKAYRLLAIARLADASTLDRGMYNLLVRILFPQGKDKQLFNGFETHHIDGDHENNVINNVILLTKHDHNKASRYLRRMTTAAQHRDYDRLDYINSAYEDFLNERLSIDYILDNC